MDLRTNFIITVFLCLMVEQTQSVCNVTLDNAKQQEISSTLSQKTTDAVYLRPSWIDNEEELWKLCAIWVIPRTSKGELTLSFSPLFKLLSFWTLSFGMVDITFSVNKTSCSKDEVYNQITTNLYNNFVQGSNQTTSKKLCYTECRYDLWTRTLLNFYECCDVVEGTLQCARNPQSATLTVMYAVVFLLFVKLTGVALLNFLGTDLINRPMPTTEPVSSTMIRKPRFIVSPQNVKEFTIIHLMKNMLLSETYIHDSLEGIMSKKACCCFCGCSKLISLFTFFFDGFHFWFVLTVVYAIVIYTSYYGYTGTPETFFQLAALVYIYFYRIGAAKLCYDIIRAKLCRTEAERPVLKDLVKLSFKICKWNPVIGILLFPLYFPILCVWFILSFIYHESQILQVSYGLSKDLCCSCTCCKGNSEKKKPYQSDHEDETQNKCTSKTAFYIFTIIAVILSALNTVWVIFIFVNFVSYTLLGFFLNTQYILKYIYIPVIIILFINSKLSSILREYGCYYSDILKNLPTDEETQGDLEKYVIKRQEDGCVKISAKFFTQVCEMKLNGCPGPLLDKLAETVVGTVLIAMMSAVIYMMLNVLSVDMTENDDITYWINIGTITFTVALWLVQGIFGLSSKDYGISEDIGPIFTESLKCQLQSFIETKQKNSQGSRFSV